MGTMICGDALSRAEAVTVRSLFGPLRPAAVAGIVAALAAAPLARAASSVDLPTAPLSGVLRADGVPLAGVSLVVRGLTGAAAPLVRVLKTDSEGTFCIADARPGVYSVLAAVPGFRSASAQVLHRATGNALSFVRLDLERDRSGVLPSGPGGALDPWAARAVAAGDVLRQAAPADAAPPETPVSTAAAAGASAAPLPASLRVQGSVSSLQSFVAEGNGGLSQTAVDVRGRLGSGVKWGLSGEYDRVVSPEGMRVGGASRVALDVLPGEGHSIRLSTNRNEFAGFEASDARLDSHSVDWDAQSAAGARASVSARLLSHRNLQAPALPSVLFRSAGSALEVDARYRRDVSSRTFVKVHVGYRSDVSDGPDATVAQAVPLERQARVGGVAGVKVFDALLVEAGGTGDYSAASRGLTPEMTLSLEALRGLTVYGFASRRFDQSVPGALTPGIVGIDPSDLVRATRAVYRAGARVEGRGGDRFELEASRREVSEAFQLLLDTDVVDRVDALYLFPGDVADELSGTVVFAIRADVAARLGLLAGRVSGIGAGSSSVVNDARYWVSSARIEVRPSGTSVAVRYRFIDQETGTPARALYSAEREMVDLTLAQELPIPVLQVFGTRWQALVSLAMGTRQEGEEAPRPNRQFAGGLSLSF
jgi:hypothetical protein